MKKAVITLVLVVQAVALIFLFCSTEKQGVKWKISEFGEYSAEASAWGKEATASINKSLDKVCGALEKDGSILLFNTIRNDKNCVVLEITSIKSENEDIQTKKIYELWITPSDKTVNTILQCTSDIQPYDFFDISLNDLYEFKEKEKEKEKEKQNQ